MTIEQRIRACERAWRERFRAAPPDERRAMLLERRATREYWRSIFAGLERVELPPTRLTHKPVVRLRGAAVALVVMASLLGWGMVIALALRACR